MVRRLAPTLAAAMAAALLTALIAPVGVAAQEVGEEPPDDSGTEEATTSEVGEQPRAPEEGDELREAFEVTGERLPLADGAIGEGIRGLLMWPEGRRVYQVVGDGSWTGTGLAAFDLDTLAEVERESHLAPPGTVLYGEQWWPQAEGFMPVDPKGGRLFLPYQSDERVQSCEAEDPCIEGVLVIDASTLDVIDDHPFQALGVDGVAAQAALRAMSYWARPGAGGRLLLLLESQVGSGGANLAGGASDRGTMTWVMQMNPVDGTVDWTERVSGCSSVTQAPGVRAVGGPRNVVFGTQLADRPPEIYLGCYITGGGAAVVRLTLDGGAPDGAPVQQEFFRGPGPVWNMRADPVAGRALFHLGPSGGGDSLLVFDGRRSSFVSALGIGGRVADSATGIEPVEGRLYAVSTRPQGDDLASRFLAGTTRGEVLPQLTAVPSLEDLVARHYEPGDGTVGYKGHDFGLAVDPADEERPTRILVRPGRSGKGAAPEYYYVIEDRRTAERVTGGALTRDLPTTDDVPQAEGATTAVFTGAARGYGFRTLLVGGLWSVISQSIARGTGKNVTNQSPGVVLFDNLLDNFLPEAAGDPFTDTGAREALGEPVGDACLDRDRELVFGIAGALDVLPDLGADGAAAQASAAVTDPQTAQDLATSTRCGEGVVRALSALLTGAGVREPAGLGGPDLSPGWDDASCVAPGEQTSDEQGSQITPTSTSYAAVACEPGRRTAATGRIRFVDLGPVTVGEASSTFEITRQPGAGLVVTMRSIARNVDIAGLVHIDAVEATAVSWATGRSQPEEAADGEYNCAEGRTAGTCLKQVLHGVSAGDFVCDQCPTNEQTAEAMQRALGDGWTVVLGEPDPFLARGVDNGALAGIVKPDDRRFAATIMNGDTLPTLPTLELVRINDDGQGRGRQVYQFAGIESSTSFGILCLLEVIDGECTQRPGALSIELLDLEGLPLAGGAFELYRDLGSDESEMEEDPTTEPSPSTTPSPTESTSPSESASPSESESASPSETASPSESASPSETESVSPSPSPSDVDVDAGGDVVADDGSLVDPLVDELVDSPCTTGADGLGDCRFENLPPGDYIVRQTGAPDGFLAAPDFALTIGPDQDLTATVTNVSAVGQVDITLVDGDGVPLAGGEFALSRPDAEPTGTCTTGADGACSITVGLPDGPADLVLSQTVAPDGLAPAPDTPFTLAPGETFTFTFTNVAPAGGTIRIGLVDDLTDAPLGGGAFEVHADDGNGQVGDADVLIATCTTGADGVCLHEPPAVDAATLGREGPLAAAGADLTVPLGAYLVRQTAAPAGYEPAADLAFAFDAPGQVAEITVRNGGGAGHTGQGSVGRSESFSPPPLVTGPTAMDVDVPAPNVAPTNAGLGGPTVQQILQAPADLARLVVRDPLQALAFLAAWALFGAAATAIHRRTVLSEILGS